MRIEVLRASEAAKVHAVMYDPALAVRVAGFIADTSGEDTEIIIWQGAKLALRQMVPFGVSVACREDVIEHVQEQLRRLGVIGQEGGEQRAGL